MHLPVSTSSSFNPCCTRLHFLITPGVCHHIVSLFIQRPCVFSVVSRHYPSKAFVFRLLRCQLPKLKFLTIGNPSLVYKLSKNRTRPVTEPNSSPGWSKCQISILLQKNRTSPKWDWILMEDDAVGWCFLFAWCPAEGGYCVSVWRQRWGFPAD